MKSLRKKAIWILLALFLLPVLIFFIWFNRQMRQQALDHALIKAIKKNDTPAAIALLDQGADANATDKPYQAMTAKSVMADLLERIGRNQPSKNARHYVPALLLSYVSGYWDEPLQFPNRVDYFFYKSSQRQGEQPIDNPKLIQALLLHGADPYSTDEIGDTVLHYACDYNHLNTVKALLDNHIDPNVKDKFGLTPLLCHTNDCARLLVENGAEVNAQDNKGFTALINAVRSDDIAAVRYLLEHGAKVSIQGQDGLTALDEARGWYKDLNLIHLVENAVRKEMAQKDSQK